MLDVSVAYNRYKFLGYEFLTWLWCMMETDVEALRKLHADIVGLDVGNRLVVENRQTGDVETVTIKGDDAGLEEARLALRKGAFVSEVNVVYQSGDQKWRFTLKGESFHLGSLKVPETGAVETDDDWEGAVLEKVFLVEKTVVLVQALYRHFMGLRTGMNWSTQVVPRMKQWIQG